MINYDCVYYCGDEDCHKCAGGHGYILSCDCCSDYTDFWGCQPRKQEDNDNDK